MKRPPVSVVPWPDESIPSMIWRLQRELGFTLEKATGLESFRKLYDDPDLAVVERLAGLLGVDAGPLARHTLEARLGAAYMSLGWRDHRQPGRWGCPTCGYQELWSRLLLVTACTACGTQLAADGRIDPAPDCARDLQDLYLRALTEDRPGENPRLERFWNLLSFHLCTGWWWPDALGPVPPPMPAGTGLGQPRNLPWREPDWMATFAQTAWPASETVKSFRAHVQAVALSTLLPHQLEPVELDRIQLHRDIRRWALEERHVPDHLLGPHYSALGGCHLEAIGYAVSRAMRREIILANNGPRLTKEQLIAGRGPLRQKREVAAINQLVDHDPRGLLILHGLARALAEVDPADRIDYRLRREILATRRTVPTDVLRRLSKPVRDRRVAARVRANSLGRDAAAWLWIELAGGVLHHSPHHAKGRLRVAALDRSLTPEDRLLLLEYGYAALGAAADDVARQHTKVAFAAGQAHADAG